MVTLARSIVTEQAALEVVVLHTTTTETLQALKMAAELARGLSARIRLIVLEVVPYPLPLDRPTIPLSFTQRRFHTLAGSAAIDTRINIHLVRDPYKAIHDVLEPHSVIVTGSRRPSWFNLKHNDLAKRLERAGHQVVYAM